MKILSQLCAVPTAPYAEHHVIRFVEKFAAARPKLRLSRDRFENLLIELPGRARTPRLVLVAHMDHPGLVARKMVDRTTLNADFYGGVLREYVNGAKVRFFDGGREIPGTVISTTPDKGRAVYPRTARVRVRSAVSPGSPGMFDQGAGRIKAGKFYSRVCDDLGGAASALAVLDELLKDPPRGTVAVLLTRAEEDAFIGALGTVLYPTLLKKSDRIISIECSAMQPYARQGDGVVFRVGDRASIFNSAFMYFLNQQAQALAKKDKRFKLQRSLMPGGICEATVFDAYGYTAGAVCVPLGNYHNMDRDRKKIGPEYVDVNDWNNMVRLLTRAAKRLHEFDPHLSPLRQRIEKRFRARRRLLVPSPLQRE
jgi:putative aminopeptidase FrvX